MLEIGIFCVILLAAGYWATMFVMGRHDDVLHGRFVHKEDEGALAPPAMPEPPPFPKRPVKAVQSVTGDRVKFCGQPTNAQSADAQAKLVTSDALQSLLVAIQQDLKSVA